MPPRNLVRVLKFTPLSHFWVVPSRLSSSSFIVNLGDCQPELETNPMAIGDADLSSGLRGLWSLYSCIEVLCYICCKNLSCLSLVALASATGLHGVFPAIDTSMFSLWAACLLVVRGSGDLFSAVFSPYTSQSGLSWFILKVSYYELVPQLSCPLNSFSCACYWICYDTAWAMWEVFMVSRMCFYWASLALVSSMLSIAALTASFSSILFAEF